MTLNLELNVSPVVNYYLVQNSMEFVIDATVFNPGGSICGLSVELRSEPEFFKPVTARIDFLQTNGRSDLKKLLEPALDPSALASVSVRTPSTVTMVAVDGDGNTVGETSCGTFVLPLDHWPGQAIPESVAAFVVPAAQSLSAVRSKASDILREWNVAPSLDGYQSDRSKVKSIGAAVFKALESLDINYIVPPDDFETSGQRVRLPDEVIANREGTCIDLSVLYAAALESVGINTLVCFTKGHAFAAFWLDNLCMPDLVIQDPSSLTVQIRNRNMLAVECTMLTSGGKGFEAACDRALLELDDADSFVAAVDIRRARGTIRPLPVARNPDGTWVAEREGLEGATSAPGDAGAVYSDMEGREQTRLDKWRRDLLDITARNPLVNMKTGTKTVTLMVSDPSAFEDSLSSGTEFSILPRPQEWNGIGAYGERPFESGMFLGNYAKSSADDLSHRWLRTPLSESELEKTMRSIYRLATKEMEESGCNSLFVSVGVMRWFDAKSGSTPRYAPLILVPASLQKRQTGFSVKCLDEEVVFNVTLLEMLKEEKDLTITVSDPLPQDENGGVNVERVLQSVRRGISGMNGWEVLDTCALGVFSFSQYVMWKDLGTNFERFRQSPIVDCLYQSLPYPGGEKVSDDFDPYGLCLAVPADGSQIRAVKAAGDGISFVMHGPPGTGKSQTITNIITNELFNGKTVLFVAEKMAALEVVQKRLDEVGIGNHCLEMHSNKTEKSKVLAQLRCALDKASAFDDADLEKLIASIEDQKRGLDRYVAALHTRNSWGLSAYECISRYESRGKGGKDFEVGASAVTAMDPQGIARLEQTVRGACTAWSAVSESDCDVLRRVGTCNVSASLQSDAHAAMECARSAAQALVASRRAVLDVGLPADIDETEGFCETVMSIDPALAPHPELGGDAGNLARTVTEMCAAAARWGDTHGDADIAAVSDRIPRARELIAKVSSAGVFDCAPASALVDSLGDLVSTSERRKDDICAVSRVWLDRVYELDRSVGIASAWNDVNSKGFLSKGKARKEFMKTVGPALKDPSVDFKDLASTVNIVSSVSGDVLRITSFASSLRGSDPEWLGKLRDLADRCAATADSLRKIGVSPGDFARIRADCGRCIPLIGTYRSCAAGFDSGFEKLRDILGLSERLGPEECMGFCDDLAPRIPVLFDWANWNSCRSRLESAGLGNAVGLITSGASADDAADSAMRSVYRTMINVCRERYEALRSFSASEFESAVGRFKQMNAKYTEYNRMELRYKLFLNSPKNDGSAAQGSELFTLLQAVQSTRMRKSIRTLLTEIPHILPRLCPCFLMSPQSAAQYLTMDYPKFDVVIFDESSQITTCKAVGALGRAKAAVIAGDSRQLPPTSFFQKRIEDDSETVDVNSFLDDCLTLNMPETYLEWHYRSRHESLIRFSNCMFYDDRMLTFPSPNDLEARVTMRKVQGVYTRRQRDNAVEAGAVVDEICRRCKDPVLRNLSIGVVAFSTTQQSCIQDMLDDRISTDKELFDGLNAMREPIFIKNLETVQGDERDVILFSIGYGPDKDGVVFQNFGPINREGGGRRLNVAASRARCEMIVFSSMSYTDVKLTPTSSTGLKTMRAFLQFAQNGGSFGDRERDIPAGSDSEILVSISKALREKGYTVHFDVGSSRFKVDAAVVDPDDPSRYILGILSDGEPYRTCANTRDREYARADILRGLGWSLVHVWSVEWYFRRSAVLDRITDELEKLRREGPQVPEEPEPQSAEPAPEPVPETVPAGRERLASLASTAPVPGKRVQYVPLKLIPVDVSSQIAISDTGIIRNLTKQLLDRDAPTSEEHLIDMYCDAVKITRLTAANRNRLTSALRSIYRPDMEDGFVTYWGDVDRTRFEIYRVSDNPADNRGIECVPLPEIINAAVDLVEKSGSLDANEMVKAVSRTLGYKRSGTNITDTIGRAIGIMTRNGTLALVNGRYVVP